MKYSKSFQKFAVIVLTMYYKCFYRIKVIGHENIPNEGCLISANHPSAHDGTMLVSCVGLKHDMAGMGKKELFSNKFYGFWLYKLGGFPVDRGKSDIKAIKQCIQSVKENKKLIIFPEGTRTIRSNKKAKAGIGLIAMKTACPIIPCYMPENLEMFKKNVIIIGKAIYPPTREEKVSSEEFAQQILDASFKIGEEYENRSC